MLTVVSFEGDVDLSINPFKLEKGSIMLLFMPPGRDVKVCEELVGLTIYQYPYWVKFQSENIDEVALQLLNNNIDYLRKFLTQPYSKFAKENMAFLSGWDVRLINIFLKKRIDSVNFIELNTAGLSIGSLELMFDFLLNELSETHIESTTYMIIEPTQKIGKINPIFIDRNNISTVFQKIYRQKSK